jgi:hypothetical protein
VDPAFRVTLGRRLVSTWSFPRLLRFGGTLTPRYENLSGFLTSAKTQELEQRHHPGGGAVPVHGGAIAGLTRIALRRRRPIRANNSTSKETSGSFNRIAVNHDDRDHRIAGPVHEECALAFKESAEPGDVCSSHGSH